MVFGSYPLFVGIATDQKPSKSGAFFVPSDDRRIMEIVTAYKCSSCNMTSVYKSSVIRHEKRCYQAPANKACQTCNYFSEDLATVYNRHHNGMPGSTDYDYLSMWCNSPTINKELHSKRVNCPSHKIAQVTIGK